MVDARLLLVTGSTRRLSTNATLRVVLGYVGARVLETSGIRVPVSHDAVGPDGIIADPATRASLAAALELVIAELEPLPCEQC